MYQALNNCDKSNADFSPYHPALDVKRQIVEKKIKKGITKLSNELQTRCSPIMALAQV